MIMDCVVEYQINNNCLKILVMYLFLYIIFLYKNKINDLRGRSFRYRRRPIRKMFNYPI